MAADFMRPLRQLSRVEDLSPDDKNWFCHQALYCIRMTNPAVVEDDLKEPNGKYHPHVSWLTKVFDNGSWNSTHRPSPPTEPEAKGIQGCVIVGEFKEDLPEFAKNREQWARRLEDKGDGVGQQQVQTHRCRKKGAMAYMRYRVDTLLDAVIPEYLDAKCRWAPADLIDFDDGVKPNDITRAQAMNCQDKYQKYLTVNWNSHLLVYLFRKRLYEDNLDEDHQPFEITGVKEYTKADYRKTPLISSYLQDMVLGATLRYGEVRSWGITDHVVPCVWL
ncbi:hypothetical protein PG993_000436 [Apiospora rasikravindrae]|uniref:Uncharacterized protein n=1 Tax=Apiospora rasikravindrae TaxID=990691 RepID=A0ABR1U8K8_9PEZI